MSINFPLTAAGGTEHVDPDVLARRSQGEDALATEVRSETLRAEPGELCVEATAPPDEALR